MKKRLLWGAAVIVAALAALGLRVVLEGRAALVEGDAAIADKRPADAIAAWESAARWYLPGAPHVGEVRRRLDGHHEASTATIRLSTSVISPTPSTLTTVRPVRR